MRVLISLLATAIVAMVFQPMLAAETITIPRQTPVELITSNPISAETVRSGDPIQVYANDDVVINGKTVIEEGQKAVITVEKAKKPGVWGRGGYLYLSSGSIKPVGSDKPIPLTLAERYEGRDRASGIALPILSLLILWPLVFMAFRKGEAAVIPAGKVINAFTVSPASIRIDTN